MKIIRPDSTHRFAIALSSEEVQGKSKNDDIINYRYFLTNLQKEDIKTNTKIDKELSDQLYEKRDLVIKNNAFSSVLGNAYELTGNSFLISSSFRYKNKNIVVFDKYQRVIDKGGHEFSYAYGYFFTNTVVWCFNDNGEVEWSKNFDYEIYSPYLQPITSSCIYDDNIAIVGHFNKELSFKTLSLSGELIEGTERQKVKNKDGKIVADLVINSIINLNNNIYLDWGFESESNNKRGGNKNISTVVLKIVEFQ